ncbi:MAG: uracil-DNA glycosylase [Candidatus Eisenbacteria bacterium]
MEREQISTELILQIEAEMARGVFIWSDPDWNAAASRFLSGRIRPQNPHPPGPSDPTAGARAARPRIAPAPAQAPPTANKIEFAPPPAADGRDPDWEQQIAEVARAARGCLKCSLHQTRTNVVVDSGSGRVPLVFIGEAPGADEDAQGEAFVGRAGQLLTRIIAAIGLDRKDVYICNVLKCRPPGNRNPMPEEIVACRPYVERQVEILKPRIICSLGLIATQMLLESKASMGTLRGRLFRYRGIPLLPTYHPAALLRNPSLKRSVWEDMLILRRILDEGPAPQTRIEAAPEKDLRAPTAQSGDLFS